MMFMCPFVLVNSLHGPLILNCLDNGVGNRVLATGSHEYGIISLVNQLADLRKKHYGAPVCVCDVGANVGVNTIAWAKHLHGWGQVVAFEPQERLFYALAGNIALNNCFNATALFVAVADKRGVVQIPEPDYHKQGNYGGVSLYGMNDIDQPVNEVREVMCLPLDNCNLGRVDILKIDVEGLEPEVIAGAEQVIAANHPIIIAEVYKRPKADVLSKLTDYEVVKDLYENNILLVHKDDKCRADIV